MASQNNAQPPPRVRLPQGTYEGCVVRAISLADPTTPSACPPTDVDVFLGIPYAQSTTGSYRFAAPVPLVVAPGDADRVHDATKLGQRCPGSTVPDPALHDIPEGEDCLNLNVYRPHNNGSSRADLLPVVVYVHGGSFNAGLGAGRDMASFVGFAAGRVVGVSFNYRLGALGFLGLLADPTTGAESPDAPLNAGLLDQQALFSWVAANIGFFGGDAGNVTLMGLSAGAHAIGHHLLCYAPGQAPFHKVICESGAATARSVWAAAHPRPQAQLRAFLDAAGIAVPSAGADTAAVAALRALPLAAVVAAARRVWDANQASVCWPFQPVVGGRVIPVPPSVAWARGIRPGLPVLTGFCSHEGTYFVPTDRARADTDAHVRAFFQTLLPAWADADADAFCRLYPDPVATGAATGSSSRYANPTPPPPPITGRQWTRLETAYAHYAYICPVLEMARVVAGCDDGGVAAAAPSAPVFVYEYAAHALPWGRANHGDNQLPVTHSVHPGPANPTGLRGLPGLTAVADAMHGAWVAFAAASPATLQESGLAAGGVAWRAWTSAAQPVMVFGAGNNERVPAFARPGDGTAEHGTVAAVRALTDDEQEQCSFWRARRVLGEGFGQQA